MSKLRSINTGFWTDPWVESLAPDEKLLFIYLFTNPLTNMLGIYECSKRKASFETGIELKRLEIILKGFEGLGKVKIIENYIILTNYIKHQRYNTNMKKSAIDVYNSLPNQLKIKGLDVSKDNPLEGFERLSKALGMVSKIEVEVEYELEEEIENEINRDKDAREEKKSTNEFPEKETTDKNKLPRIKGYESLKSLKGWNFDNVKVDFKTNKNTEQ